MKFPLSASVASFALVGAAPAVLSSAADVASKQHVAATFEGQVIEGRDRAAATESTAEGVGGDRVVADVMASHPHLTSSSNAQAQACESYGEVLGNCLATKGADETERYNCAMCFLTTLDPGGKHTSCEGLQKHDWCFELDRCRRSNCERDCTVEFLDGANCILAASGCDNYQCSKAKFMSAPAYRTGLSGVAVAVIAIGAGLVQLL